MFIVELTTHDGRVSERYETYAEAQHRLEQFPADSLTGPAFIFEELLDGSERLVREDGKPIQFHRPLIDEVRECADAPLPLVENPSGIVGPDGKARCTESRAPQDDCDDLLPF